MTDKSSTPDSDRLLTKDELAQRWGVTRRTLEKWQKAGKGPRRIHLGTNRVMYSLADVISFEKQATEKQGGAQ